MNLAAVLILVIFYLLAKISATLAWLFLAALGFLMLWIEDEEEMN